MGILSVSRFYHEAMVLVLQERQQTYQQAADELEISITTFSKIIRLQNLPNFHTERGKQLAQRFDVWSEVPVWLLFPEAFFTIEFIKAPKICIESRSFREIMRMGGRNLTFVLPAPTATKQRRNAKPERKRRRVKRRK